MHYYTVWVRSLGYRGKAPLTYQFAEKLQSGAIVLVPLQKESVLGFIAKEVPKPSFATKPIIKAFTLPSLPLELTSLAGWLQAFYNSSVGVISSQLLPTDIADTSLETIKAVVNKPFTLPVGELTTEQAAVVNSIDKPDTHLLHGRTGSGKTRVYIELAAQAIAAGRSVLVLTPEISLTSQLGNSLRAVFGEQVLVLHSQQTPKERREAWLTILTCDAPLIVVGPRSILFTPLKNIGLIVVDEAHETAYKQEQSPYYHALRVASQLSQLHKANLIIGSATPSIADYFMAEQRGKPILKMTQLAQPAAFPDTITKIVDLKDRSLFNRSQHLSTALIQALQAALANGEQSLVYLNRRGTARVILCEHCGWQALCPHCDLPLTYHADSSQFLCHTCGYHESIIISCPICGHPSLQFKSFGTKAIMSEVQQLLPEARVQRFDTDNTKAERFEQHYDAVKVGEVDILVGTQLLAKGLDLPLLSTVGVVLADSSLSIPDFSSQERSYQLLTQVLGRVGRGHRQGHAIIQTYHPDSIILKAAIANDWDDFYRRELAERKQFHFPPFYHLLKLTCRRASPKAAEIAAEKLKFLLLEKITGISVDGPAPSFHEKIQGKYQYQLVVKSTNRSLLLSVIDLLPSSGWTYDIDPVNLL